MAYKTQIVQRETKNYGTSGDVHGARRYIFFCPYIIQKAFYILQGQGLGFIGQLEPKVNHVVQ